MSPSASALLCGWKVKSSTRQPRSGERRWRRNRARVPSSSPRGELILSEAFGRPPGAGSCGKESAGEEGGFASLLRAVAKAGGR